MLGSFFPEGFSFFRWAEADEVMIIIASKKINLT
jgi:hypothetical protein